MAARRPRLLAGGPDCVRRSPSVRTISPAAALAAVLAFLPCCGRTTNPAAGLVSETRTLMGTVVTITACGDESRIDNAVGGAFETMASLEAELSKHNPESGLSRLNASAGRGKVAVSEELIENIELSVRISRLSGGAFDATVGPIMKLWKDAAKSGRMPAEEAVAGARLSTGFGRIDLDRAGRKAGLPEGMSLDLGGIAKGYIVDRAARTLILLGASSGLVVAGGDLYAFGNRRDGGPWRVGVQNPKDPDSTDPVAVLEISDCGVTTSGHYQRFTEIEGKRISHIVDPATGMPVDNGILSVTVVAPSAAFADGLSTSVAVMGERRGLDLVESLESVECLLLVDDGKGGFRTVMSSGMGRHIIRGR